MSDAKAGLAAPTILILTLTYALVGPLLSVAPLGMAPLLIAAAVIAAITERLQSGRWAAPSAITAGLVAALVAWCALSLIWDIKPADGARKLFDLAVVAVALLTLLGLGSGMTEEQRRRVCLALVGGISVGLIILCIETAFDFPLYRAVLGSSNPRLIDAVEAKRSTDALPLAVWPASLALFRLGKVWLAGLLVILFTGTCAVLTASSATVGMAFSLLMFGGASLSVLWTRRVLAAGTILAFLLIIPGAIFAYREGASTSHMVKASGQHRTEIWDFAARKSLDRPLFGHGFNSSRFVPNDGQVSQFLGPGKPIIPLHPHNAFLQIWLELGGVGVIVVAALLLNLLRRIGRWPDPSARFMLATYAAAIVVAGLAFGIWQTWWMATLAFGIAACRAIAPQPDPAGPHS